MNGSTVRQQLILYLRENPKSVFPDLVKYFHSLYPDVPIEKLERKIYHQLRKYENVLFKREKDGRTALFSVIENIDEAMIEAPIEGRRKSSNRKKIKFSSIYKTVSKDAVEKFRDFIKKADIYPTEGLELDKKLELIKEAIVLTLDNVEVRKIVITDDLDEFKRLIQEDLDYVIYYDKESNDVPLEELLPLVEKIANDYNVELTINVSVEAVNE